MKNRKIRYLLLLILLAFAAFITGKRFNLFHSYEVGQAIDSLNGVKVYYNGDIDHIQGRRLAPDGYNIGLKFQCVEFVKRYYYQHLKHKMPDASGHAVDFFTTGLKDGAHNKRRNLIQYSNPSASKPKVDDLLVYSGKFGHVAIISAVGDDNIEVIQQNPGPWGKSRVRFSLDKKDGKWLIGNERILGWLRKE